MNLYGDIHVVRLVVRDMNVAVRGLAITNSRATSIIEAERLKALPRAKEFARVIPMAQPRLCLRAGVAGTIRVNDCRYPR